jgi:hypothetical protein
VNFANIQMNGELIIHVWENQVIVSKTKMELMIFGMSSSLVFIDF